jgi:OST-HTH Associated domain
MISIFPKGVFWEGSDLKILVSELRPSYQLFLNFLNDYFEEERKVSKPDSTIPMEAKSFPGGRYGCAHFVKLFGSNDLPKYSIGVISQFVQQAINENILQYHKTLLVWRPSSITMKEDALSINV